MTRSTVVVLVLLASCSKKSDDKSAAPAAGSNAVAPGDEAKEAARSSGLLGPTDQDSFKGEPVAGNAPAQKATVTVSKVTLEPATDGATVSDAVTKRMDELTACYQDALMSHDAEQGVITATFTIKPDGKLSGVEVKSMMNDSSLEACISDSFNSVKLAKPLGKAPLKATVELTLSLK